MRSVTRTDWDLRRFKLWREISPDIRLQDQDLKKQRDSACESSLVKSDNRRNNLGTRGGYKNFPSGNVLKFSGQSVL